MSRKGPMTELPGGWDIEVLDQGPGINEVWLVVRPPEDPPVTKVVARDTAFGAVLLKMDADRLLT